MTYIFDSSFEGLLCCVFNAFSRHEQPGLLQRHDAPRSLFHDELNVITDGEQSDRVWNALMLKLSPGELNALTTSFLCEDPGFDTSLFRLICRIFTDGAACMRDFSSPDTLAMLQNARRVNAEAHRVLQFMRFKKPPTARISV